MQLLTLRSVLVASDMGATSVPALETAAALARLADARLHLLHVAEAEIPGGEARLREQARELAKEPRPATARVIVGEPAETIVADAEEVEADVIVLGPHRRWVSGPGALGSTAAEVIHISPFPCLIAVGRLSLPLHRVVVPTDLSEAARGALAVALSWASALRPPGGEAELVVLHVHPEASDSSTAEERLRAEVERARADTPGAARVRVREALVPGDDPAAEILRRAEEGGADLLVMGTRGAAREDSPFGSVSAVVARETPRPLLLVPPAVWSEVGA